MTAETQPADLSEPSSPMARFRALKAAARLEQTEPAYLGDIEPAITEHWSREAEQAVLGGLMFDNAAFSRCGDLLQARSFWHGPHGAIWTAIAGLIQANQPADILTVHEALKAAKRADDCGGMAYLNTVLQSTPGAGNIRRYAQIVAEKAARRAVLDAAGKALSIARETAPVGDLLDRIAAEFSGLQRDQMRKGPVLLADLMTRAVDRYTDLAAGNVAPGWATGIAPLDRILAGGLRPGKVYGLAARPSVGKSSAARAIGLHLAGAGHPVLLLSQEMPTDEIADCAMSQLGGIDNGRLATGQFIGNDWSRVTDAVEAASSLPLHIDDEGGLTIGGIRGKARMVKGLKVLLLDYLQLSTSTLKGASTNDQVAEITKGLKQLALQLGIAVVLLSQLNRDVEKRQDKEPQLSDLRDSGAIEQDIDAAIFLWTAQEPDSNGSRLVGWRVAKNRGGPLGKFAMRFDAAIYRWTESTESLQQQANSRRSEL
jgi:replicative DNA helicase